MDYLQSTVAAVIGALFKVSFNLRHLIGDMSETDNVFGLRLRKGI